MQGCLLIVGTQALFTIFAVSEDYELVQNKMVQFQQSVLRELLTLNILTELDEFSAAHQEHLNDMAERLNMDLLERLVESIRGLVSAQDSLGLMLTQCLSDVE